MKRNTGVTPLPAPAAPPSADLIEKRIIALCQTLINKKYSSCLEKRFRTTWDAILSLFSRYQKEVLKNYPLNITCSDNCGTCCYHWPEDTYSFEVQYIALYLKKHRKDGLGRITTALKADIDCLERIQTAVREKLKDPAAKKALGKADPYDLALSSFYRFQRPCPLLDKKGSCTIYSIRPITCRVYVSFSPRELCRPRRIGGDDALTCLLDIERDAGGLFDTLHFMYDTFDGDTSFRSMLYKALR